MNVVVLGAGIVGASVADALAARGVAVRVLDMRSPGRGASQASAGMLAPYTEAHDHAELLELGARSLALFDPLVESLRSDLGRHVEYARTGSLQVAFSDSEAGELRQLAQSVSGLGVPVQWLGADDVRACEPSVSREAIGGVFLGAHGFVGVDSLVQALVERASLAGATFEAPVEVIGVEQRGDGVDIRVGERRDRADVVVIATGSWSRRVRVANVQALPVRPVRGQLLHLRWTAPGRPSRIVWGPRCYTVPWSDGSLLVGATVEDAGFEEDATVKGVHALTGSVASLLPASADATFESVRVGLRPATTDGLPAIGPLARAPRVVVATGHFRNGVLLAPLTAELVTRWICDGIRDPALALTTPDRLVS